MKKIVASVGLVALGASGIQTASAQPVLGGPPGAKPWNVSATLRGFYDDNFNTAPNDVNISPRSTWGWEVSPAAALKWDLQQTTINIGFLYSLLYYQNKPINNTDHYDQNFTFNVALTHAFNERFQGQVSDSFVIGQEPDFLRAGNALSTFQRISGDNIRNYGDVGLDAQLTPKFGLSAGYDNAYYDYSDEGSNVGGGFKAGGINFATFPPTVIPSNSGLLDRMENSVHLDGVFTIKPTTKGLVGVRFRDASYNGDELIGINPDGTPVVSKDRNFREYSVYVGGQHSFTPELNGTLRVGGSYIDYYNDPASTTDYAPYVDLSMSWTYAEESYVQGGFSYDLNSSDQIALGTGNNNFTLSAYTAVLYAKVNHRLTPKLFASATGTFQNSTYNGGSVDGQSEQFYLLGLSLEYRFTENFSAQVGYDYDNLQSGLTQSAGVPSRSYDRNRVYMGLTARY